MSGLKPESLVDRIYDDRIKRVENDHMNLLEEVHENKLSLAVLSQQNQGLSEKFDDKIDGLSQIIEKSVSSIAAEVQTTTTKIIHIDARLGQIEEEKKRKAERSSYISKAIWTIFAGAVGIALKEIAVLFFK